jgi:hypothetical protein
MDEFDARPEQRLPIGPLRPVIPPLPSVCFLFLFLQLYRSSNKLVLQNAKTNFSAGGQSQKLFLICFSRYY